MALWDDVQAILADASLGMPARRAKAANVKAVAIRDALLALGTLPHTFPAFSYLGHSYTLTITRVEVGQLAKNGLTISETGGAIAIWCMAIRDGVTLDRYANGERIWPIVIQDPRILLADPAGTVVAGNGVRGRVDVVALAKATIGDVLNAV